MTMKYIASGLLAFALSGCAGIIAGAATAYHNDLVIQHQKDFLADYQKRSAERQAAGQTPLNWCEELRTHNFKPGESCK
jgi:hypothetical protein